MITINVDSEQKFSQTSGNFNGNLPDNGGFGSAIAVIGDLEADGVTDLVVGAPLEDQTGAAWILFMDKPDTRTECERDSLLRFPGIGECQ